jgi:hypothetical protein
MMLCPQAAEQLAVNGELADQFGQRGVVGVMARVDAQERDQVTSLHRPVGEQRLGLLVAEHQPGEVALARRERVEIGDKSGTELVPREHIGSSADHERGSVGHRVEQMPDSWADPLRWRRMPWPTVWSGQPRQVGALLIVES